MKHTTQRTVTICSAPITTVEIIGTPERRSEGVGSLGFSNLTQQHRNPPQITPSFPAPIGVCHIHR